MGNEEIEKSSVTPARTVQSTVDRSSRRRTMASVCFWWPTLCVLLEMARLEKVEERERDGIYTVKSFRFVQLLHVGPSLEMALIYDVQCWAQPRDGFVRNSVVAEVDLPESSRSVVTAEMSSYTYKTAGRIIFQSISILIS